jgi:hypothetical protein
MKIKAAVINETVPYDKEHSSRLVISVAAPEEGGEPNALNASSRLSWLGTDRCDSRPTYATDLVLEVTALAGHRIDHVASALQVTKASRTGVTIRLPEVRIGECREVVLGVVLVAQRQAFPRPVNVFGVKLGYDVPSGERRLAEARARATFVKSGGAGT